MQDLQAITNWRRRMKEENILEQKLEEYENKVSELSAVERDPESTGYLADSLFMMIYLERIRILKWVLDIADEKDTEKIEKLLK